MPLLPTWLRQLFKKKRGKDDRAFASEIDGLELIAQDRQASELMDYEESGESRTNQKTKPQDFEIFPADPAVRKQWFALTVRERQVGEVPFCDPGPGCWLASARRLAGIRVQ